MSLVKVTYKGPNGTRGAVLTAVLIGTTHHVTVPYPYEANGIQAFAVAARALYEKTNFKGTVSGAFLNGSTAVFMLQRVNAVCEV